MFFGIAAPTRRHHIGGRMRTSPCQSQDVILLQVLDFATTIRATTAVDGQNFLPLLGREVVDSATVKAHASPCLCSPLCTRILDQVGTVARLNNIRMRRSPRLLMLPLLGSYSVPVRGFIVTRRGQPLRPMGMVPGPLIGPALLQ